MEQIRQNWRFVSLALRLTWCASPRLLLSLLFLLGIRSILPSLQLLLSGIIINRVAIDLGLSKTFDAFASQVSLAVSIAIAGVILALSQVIDPCLSTLESLAGDQVTKYVSEELLRAANRWQGLERFEEPTFADDLKCARERAASAGLDLMVEGAQIALSLFTTVSLAVVLLSLHPLIPLILI
ncbi:hypothetical protein [Microseira wollei]|uniref:ABC transporter ATP-binding protein n=1 Tax=Microseira wollei NIES-4236 TaxID=2530354 RepID=A0AAV3XR15_9CYAN|nr:hypothetical protein [Microseira wollei]GET44188.1 hypothetical protein MiSe_90140 [Microseira wollei NIES-4236]